jgi:Flp pilus assembly protein TadG
VHSPGQCCGTAGRRGAALTELALVLIPLLALLLAILDFGFAIFLRSTFQHAVREGVRYAVTGRREDGLGHDASIKGVVQRNAMGFLSGSAGAEKIHIRYYVPGTLAETASNAGGNIVEVTVEGFTWRWMAPLLRGSSPATILARSSDRMEPSPGGVPPPR